MPVATSWHGHRWTTGSHRWKWKSRKRPMRLKNPCTSKFMHSWTIDGKRKLLLCLRETVFFSKNSNYWLFFSKNYWKHLTIDPAIIRKLNYSPQNIAEKIRTIIRFKTSIRKILGDAITCQWANRPYLNISEIFVWTSKRGPWRTSKERCLNSIQWIMSKALNFVPKNRCRETGTGMTRIIFRE